MEESNDRPNQTFIQNFMDNSASLELSRPQKQKMPLKKKLIIAGAIILLFVLVFAFRAAIRSKDGNAIIGETAVLNIKTVPFNADVEINGVSYQNGIHRLPSGKCHAVITADGFIQKELDFELAGNANSYFLQYLLPDSGEYSEEEIDLLRFITNNDQVDKIIENFLVDKGKDYVFPSQRNGIFAGQKRIAAKGFSKHADDIIRQTISAFFYYVRPDVKHYDEIQYSSNGALKIIIDKYAINYAVSFVSTYTNGKTKEKE